MFLERTKPKLKVRVQGVGEDSYQEREGKLKGANGILVCSKEANTNFGHAKTKGLATKRRTIARSQKDLKIQIALTRPQGQSTIISHQQSLLRRDLESHPLKGPLIWIALALELVRKKVQLH